MAEKTEAPAPNLILGDADGGRLAENIMHFGRVLRAAGLPVGPGKVLDAIDAVATVGVDSRKDFYWTLHAVFVNKRDQRLVFDQAFRLFWRSRDLVEKMIAMFSPKAPPRQEEREKVAHFPEEPQRDVLLFLLRHGDLPQWKADILQMIREEAYYFAPQAQTKIMNEGWATFWHTRLMTDGLATIADIVHYADHHSGTVAMSPYRLNPYKLGLELFRDIEERWNMGRFGKEWEDCDDLSLRLKWDTQAGRGREKIFEVRKHYNDVTFIDEFLTPEFVMEQKMFNYGFNKKTSNWEIVTKEFKAIKNKLLGQLTNFGQPFIDVTNGNYENRGELFLLHRYDGVDLRDDYMRDTLSNLQALWSRQFPFGFLYHFSNSKHLIRLPCLRLENL